MLMKVGPMKALNPNSNKSLGRRGGKKEIEDISIIRFLVLLK